MCRICQNAPLILRYNARSGKPKKNQPESRADENLANSQLYVIEAYTS